MSNISTMTRTPNNKIIVIDGNIGSGKTTLIEILKEKYKNDANIIFLREPVDEWEDIKDEHGETMLQKFYADQPKYAFSFQMMAYISRLALLIETMNKHPDAIIISERSLHTDKHVFAKMLYETKVMEEVNYKIYCKWFSKFSEKCLVDKWVYLHADPSVCCERVAKRSRKGEDVIPLDYLKLCDSYHERMFSEIMQVYSEDVIILNGNIDIYSEPDEVQKWLKTIDDIIYL